MKLVEHQDLVVGVQEHLDQHLYMGQMELMEKQGQQTPVAVEVERRPEERRHEAVAAVAAEAEGLHNALRSQQARLCRSICLAEHQECP